MFPAVVHPRFYFERRHDKTTNHRLQDICNLLFLCAFQEQHHGIMAELDTVKLFAGHRVPIALVVDGAAFREVRAILRFGLLGQSVVATASVIRHVAISFFVQCVLGPATQHATGKVKTVRMWRNEKLLVAGIEEHAARAVLAFRV